MICRMVSASARLPSGKSARREPYYVDSPRLPHVSSKDVHSDPHDAGQYRRRDTPDRALADGLPQIIWSSDANGHIEWVNDRWFDLTGLSEEQTLYDRGGFVAVHPDDRDDLL